MPPTARTISPTNIIRAYEAKIDDVIPGERSVVSKINTNAVDRYRTVIQPQGGDLEGYRKNPVVLWEHGKDPQRGTMPIGRNQWIRATEQQIIAKTVFRNDDYSQMLFEAYQDGGLRGWSVNILPSEASPPTKDEMRAAPSAMQDCQMVYRKWELAEYSGVSVPGNADTLTLIASRGIYVPDDAKPIRSYPAMHQHAQQNPSITDQYMDKDVYRYITHEGAYWIVHAEDGKVLGKHNNKGDADAQLSAIEAHKHDDKRSWEGGPVHSDPFNQKRSGRWIEGDGDAWAIVENGQVIVVLPSHELATRCLDAMSNPVAWTDIHDRMAAEQTKRNLDVMGDVQAMLELALLGKV